MKKLICLLGGVLFLTACGHNTWVLEKDRLSEVGDVHHHVSQLQSYETDFRGYEVFTISEGKKMVVVSTGKLNRTLNFNEAEFEDDQTTVHVEENEEQTTENNPYIMIGLDEIEGELRVINQHEEEFKSNE